MHTATYSLVENTLIRRYGTSQELAKEMIKLGKVQQLNKGDFIYFQDGRSEFITFLITGILGFHQAGNGNSGVYVNIIYPGIILNETQFFMGGNSPLDINTSCECRVLTLSFKKAQNLIASSLEFNQMLNQSMAKKQRALSRLFHLSSERPPQKKVYKALEVLSDLNQDDVLPINILSLASLLNMSRNTVGSALKTLISNGIIDKAHPGYRIAKKDLTS